MFGEIGGMINGTLTLWRIVAIDRNGYPIGKWGVMNKEGELIIPMNYEYIERIYEFQSGFNGFKLQNGEVIIETDMFGNKMREIEGE